MSNHLELTQGARVLLVGAGRVGTAVTSLLARRGFVVAGVASRTSASALRAADLLGAPALDLGELPPADLVVVGAVDSGIGPLAERVAASAASGAVVLHLSGVSGVAPLQSVTDVGGTAWALHPVQACPDVRTAMERLPGSAWGVTAPADEERAMNFVRSELGGTPVAVPEEARPLWHAASVMTSNGISALMAFGEQILDSIGISDGKDVLGPLAAGTVANARDGGGGAATLTGPVVRGEVDTVSKHLRALGDAPDLVERYRRVARMILDAADAGATLDAPARRAIEELL